MTRENTLVLNRGRMVLAVFNMSLLAEEIKNRPVYQATKRGLDILAGLVGTVLAAPVVLGAKIAYVLSGDFAPVIFKQKRIGRGGAEFELFKIRSMVMDADKKLEEVLKNPVYAEEWRKNQKLNKDPRITKVGKVLRKTSLDEVPQFLNVLIGDMSLIGPRPLVNGEIEKHAGNAKLYQRVRPGLTGWWGANSSKASTYDKRLELEYYYVRNQKFTLDVRCFFLTIKTVLKGRI